MWGDGGGPTLIDQVLYRCDRKTPAWNHYAGEGNNETDLIPIDFSNPAVVQWQLEQLVATANGRGYDAIAWDNYALENEFLACGAFRNGTWTPLYLKNSTSDPAFSAAAIQWLQRVRSGVNTMKTKQGRPMIVIPNYSLGGRNWNDSEVLAVGNATDGVLSEAGFSDYGRLAGFSAAAWEQRILFMRNLQANGVAYYSINELGDPNPAHWYQPCSANPLNCIGPRDRQFVIASYLMGNEGISAV